MNTNSDYKGRYNRLFPSKISTTSFLTIYILFLFGQKTTFYGKELIDAIEQKFKGRWKPSHGIVYPMLRDLEEQGLLIGLWEKDGDSDKKTKRIYTITTKGREVFKQTVAEHREVFIDSYAMMVQILRDLYTDEYEQIKEGEFGEYN